MADFIRLYPTVQRFSDLGMNRSFHVGTRGNADFDQGAFAVLADPFV
jgi:hypothetical protein